MNMAETVGKVEAANARANRWLVRIAAGATLILLASGVTTVTLQVQAIQRQERTNIDAEQDREELKWIGRELRDCTTPTDVRSECQKRLAQGNLIRSRQTSEDNLRASIAVGTCLRAQAPNVEECALDKFRALTAAADARRASEPPQP